MDAGKGTLSIKPTLEEQLYLLQSKNRTLKAESRAKTEFMMNLIHDIRSPLAGIVGLAGHLAEKSQNSPEKEYVQAINEGSKQLLDLLNGVIHAKSSFKQETKIKKQAFHLNKVLERVRELEEPSLLDKHLKIKISVDEQIPTRLISDELKLERILLNLVANAIKFTEKGLIQVEVKLLSSIKNKVLLEFCVSDTGIGIASNQLNQIFTRHYTNNAPRKTHYSSAGLGLDIVQKYVNLLGGDINVKSKVGKGTSFTFRLSMNSAKTSTNTSIHSKGKDKEIQLDKNLNFLLVDDNPIVLAAMKWSLETLNLKPQTAATTEEAFQLILKRPFDVIISDIELPDDSGYNLTKKIRALNNKQSTPIIIGLTGHSIKDIKNQCTKAGMDDVYQKPLAFVRLKELAEQAMAIKELRLRNKTIQ